MPGTFLTSVEAAKFLTEECECPTSPNTLDKLRTLGGGPVYQKVGRRVRYTEPRLREYAASKISPERRSTSEQVAAPSPAAA